MAPEVALERETNGYWDLIKSVRAEVKIALIARLSNSLMNETTYASPTVDSLVNSIVANAPKDVPLTDEDIMEEVKAVRYAR